MAETAAAGAARVRAGAARAGPGRRRGAARRAADRRRLVRHLAHRHARRARSAPSARCPSCAWPPTGTRPIERNRYEARWMQVAAGRVPGSAPRVLGQHPALGVLVMSYLPPADHPLWKAAAARRPGRHRRPRRRSARRWRASTPTRPRAPNWPRSSTPTASSSTSGSSPICSPPRRATPTWRRRCSALVAQTQAHKRALVHGDVSPKNILIGPHGPVLLDAECAWWGDPAFDLAFCLNHLLLKCLWTPAATAGFLACFDALAETYLAGVDWEPRAARRAARRGAAAGPAAGARRRQVAGRIPRRRRAARRGAPRRARAAAAAPVRGSPTCAPPGSEELER